MSAEAVEHMQVGCLYRYPVKSMLGESVDTLFVNAGGPEGDRQFALIDESSGRVASAKQARLWRGLLSCGAVTEDRRVRIHLPDGSVTTTDEEDVDHLLSQLVGRPVHLIDSRPAGASIERADPDQVLDMGVEAEVDAPLLELAMATPGNSFHDLAPVHAITTATLERIGVEAARYRPNLVIATPPGYPAYAENEWTDHVLSVGGTRLRAMGPTPRCVIPTLEHGHLPRAPHALRTPAAENRVDAFGLGLLPCAGTYLQVLSEGAMQIGDRVSLD
ncbi:MOSC N-terminal beta barrel domain-containing protein [Mycolicibacterium sp. 050232]|uniref:MOSC domain-containing protein n=1 Tax=Mycolicibacterium sp. 050232 TaxID=3113982 RepID=UPI002E2B6ABA|nr:MOSC N-terminal beta barrel domain-containing protein [Mycolicibacterium sp. 050232]MED5812691.1 MOSC N-terminal beta barrel domain-containing protein [Mycolicibacterium sp. 050232]